MYKCLANKHIANVFCCYLDQGIVLYLHIECAFYAQKVCPVGF